MDSEDSPPIKSNANILFIIILFIIALMFIWLLFVIFSKGENKPLSILSEMNNSSNYAEILPV